MFFSSLMLQRFLLYLDNGWKAAGISDALEIGSSKMPSIDPFHDIDPMLSDDIEQPGDCHLLAICDVTVEEFELLCGSRIQDSDDGTDDSEWEEAES